MYRDDYHPPPKALYKATCVVAQANLLNELLQKQPEMSVSKGTENSRAEYRGANDRKGSTFACQSQ